MLAACDTARSMVAAEKNGKRDTHELNALIGGLWIEFRHEVILATGTLMHMLSGIRAQEQSRRSGVLPDYPPIRAFPVISDAKIPDQLEPGGRADQLAYRAWITEVYDELWELRTRPRLKRAFEELGTPRKKILAGYEPIGDLRLIRNNLLHGRTALRDKAAACKILRWFREGEVMRLQFRHVLDFLNQMDCLPERPTVIPDSAVSGRFSYWIPLWRTDKVGSENAAELVSVRPLDMSDEEDWRYQFCVRVVFEDGVFGQLPFHIPGMEGFSKEMTRQVASQLRRAEIRDGNLHLPGLGSHDGAEIYRSCFQEPHDGPGTSSRPMQISQE